jgi:membrane-bound lytic murein transglycosylase D
MTIMEKNAAEYGLDGIELDPPLAFDTVEASAPTSLALISDIIDTPGAEMAALNPAILKGIVPEGYPLRVPKGSGNQLLAALQLIPAEHRNSWRVHRVGAGETLAAIGKRYAALPGSIVAANHLPSAQAAEGDLLLIPAALRVEAPVRRTTVAQTTVARTAAHRRTPVHRTSAKASVAKSTAPAPPVHKSPPILTRTASR